MFSIPFKFFDHENYTINPFINDIFLHHIANISNILKLQVKT